VGGRRKREPRPLACDGDLPAFCWIFSIMATLLRVSGFLLFLLLWGAAWRRQPNLAVGIFIGVAIAAVVAAFVRRLDVHDVPLWLPPLPFAVVAISLLCFGIWAWVLGRRTG
jgi:hypothetical protein